MFDKYNKEITLFLVSLLAVSCVTSSYFGLNVLHAR